jgi:hypothetical protein
MAILALEGKRMLLPRTDFLGCFVRIRLQSWQKSTNMTPKIFFHYILKWVSKNVEFDVDFKFVEKSVKKFLQKKVFSQSVQITYLFNF